jgi:hypothetical protein
MCKVFEHSIDSSKKPADDGYRDQPLDGVSTAAIEGAADQTWS